MTWPVRAEVPLRIIVDEDLSPSIAQELWALGFEATSIRDRGMLGWKDWQLLPWLTRELWTLCTDNGAEWERRARRWREQGNSHCGVLIVRQAWGTDGVVRALNSYLSTEAPDSLMNEVIWVPPPDSVDPR